MNKSTINHYLVTLMIWLTLIRGTNIGYGYPTAENMIGSIGFMPQKLMQIVVLMLLVCFFFLNIQSILRWMKFPVVISIFLLVVVVSAVLSPERALAIRFLVSVIVVSLPIYLYYKVYSKDSLFYLFVNFLIVMLIVNILYSVAFSGYAFMTANHAGALRGMFVHKNAMGSFMALAAIVFYAGLFIQNGLPKKWNLAYFLLSSALVALSLSGTAIVILAIGLISFHTLGFITKMKETSAKVGIISLYLIALSSLYLLSDIYIPVILDLLGKDPTLTGRTLLWETLFEIALEKPLLGYGAGVFLRPEIMYEYTTAFGWAAKTAHNSYLDLVLGIGFPLTLIFLVMCLRNILVSTCAVPQTPLAGHQSRIVNTLFICIIVYALASSGAFMTPSITWMLFFMCGLIQAALITKNSESKQ